MNWLGPFPAPAKLNLFLHVTGRRADGYHLLQTVFRFIDWQDELWFARRADGAIRRREGPVGVDEDDDLCVRAARRLAREVDRQLPGVDIRLVKSLPMGGGLGGGSSDAATVLRVLQRLWGLELARDRLAAIALELGADVPFFIGDDNAWGEGVGERLLPVALPPAWYVVLTPPVSVATASVFAHPALTRDTIPVTMHDFPGAVGQGRNDLEAVVRELHPEVDLALGWLARHGDARMSGSGATVFAAFTEMDAARRVARQAPDGYLVRVVQGLDRHPLLSGPAWKNLAPWP